MQIYGPTDRINNANGLVVVNSDGSISITPAATRNTTVTSGNLLMSAGAHVRSDDYRDLAGAQMLTSSGATLDVGNNFTDTILHGDVAFGADSVKDFGRTSGGSAQRPRDVYIGRKILFGNLTELQDDAADVLALRRGGNPQTFRVYGQYNSPTDYNAVEIFADDPDGIGWVRSIQAGTAPPLDFRLGTATDISISLLIQNAIGWVIEDSSSSYSLRPSGDNAQDLGLSLTRVRSGYFGTSVVCPTFTNAAGADVAVDAPAGQNVLFKINGTTCWKINSNGNLVVQTDGGKNIGSAGGGTGGRPLDIYQKGVFREYNNDATAGNGLASIVAQAAQTGQSAAIASTGLFTPPANGLYRVNIYLVTTTAGNAVTVSATIGYTDDAQAQTFTTGTIAINTLGAVQRQVLYIRALTTAAITYSTTISGALGAGRYALFISLERLL